MSSRQIFNPLGNGVVFAVIPRLTLDRVEFQEANVVLPEGKHIGPNKGFGAAHIWAEHQREMAAVGLQSFGEVPLFVLPMLKHGTPLHFEGASWRATRLLAVRTAAGTVVLEHRQQRGGDVWSIVTAFSGTKTHGTRVGSVR